MKNIKRMSVLFLILVLLVGCTQNNPTTTTLDVSEATKIVLEDDLDALNNYEEFLRIDLDSVTAYEDELEALRFFKEGMYELTEAKEKYMLDPEYPVDLTGLDDLKASGSAQFSKDQFLELADSLKEIAPNDKIVIVDLREESHYLLNGISISVFSLHNWGNLAKPLEQLEQEEKEFFTSLLNTDVTAYERDDEIALEAHIDMHVTEVMSEKELVESVGFEYLRLDCTDHVFPMPNEIDAFIDYIKTVDLDNTWFHFHCAAGKGRTGTFLTLLDMIKNPEVSMDDILYRHAHTSSNYPLFLGEDDDGYKIPLYKEKAELTPLLYEYVQEELPNNFETPWSEWLENNQK